MRKKGKNNNVTVQYVGKGEINFHPLNPKGPPLFSSNYFSPICSRFPIYSHLRLRTVHQPQ